MAAEHHRRAKSSTAESLASTSVEPLLKARYMAIEPCSAAFGHHRHVEDGAVGALGDHLATERTTVNEHDSLRAIHIGQTRKCVPSSSQRGAP